MQWPINKRKVRKPPRCDHNLTIHNDRFGVITCKNALLPSCSYLSLTSYHTVLISCTLSHTIARETRNWFTGQNKVYESVSEKSIHHKLFEMVSVRLPWSAKNVGRILIYFRMNKQLSRFVWWITQFRIAFLTLKCFFINWKICPLWICEINLKQRTTQFKIKKNSRKGKVSRLNGKQIKTLNHCQIWDYNL